MNIGIIGTRGIPNHYGGFEQFAEYLSLGLTQRGHQVTVYNSHTHPYQQSEWKGVQIVHCNDPEDKIGTAGQFLYDFNCIRDTRKKNFDIILQLGYTSSSVWGRFLPRKKSIVTTNMDGLEWKRTKYSAKVQRFLQQAEKWGVKYSDYLIADSIGIQDYLKDKYGKLSVYIPYGAHLFRNADISSLEAYQLEPFEYDMLIARLEPENSIETILDGASLAAKRPFLVVGKHETQYGSYLKERYKHQSHIRFVGGVYNIQVLNNLRHYSNLYFHGHTVGGTNPSLLEAMASQALICAHNNIFNRSILGVDAFYFDNVNGVETYLCRESNEEEDRRIISANERKIAELYDWEIIINQYESHFEKILNK